MYLDICWWYVLIMISMRTISAIRRQDPILGIASADKGRALDVLGATRALCLRICYYLLFSVVPVDGSPGETRISIDSSFCWLYNSVSCFLGACMCTLMIALIPTVYLGGGEVGWWWSGGGGRRGGNRFRDQHYRTEQFLTIAGYKRWKDRP